MSKQIDILAFQNLIAADREYDLAVRAKEEIQFIEFEDFTEDFQKQTAAIYDRWEAAMMQRMSALDAATKALADAIFNAQGATP